MPTRRQAGLPARGLLALSLVLLLGTAGGPTVGAATPRLQFFPETGHTVVDPFLTYWERTGGLDSYGYPLTEVINEDGLQVQYFERARFEYHPEHAGTPAEVMLSLLGAQLTSGRAFAPGSQTSGYPYFSVTGHTLHGAFLTYWLNYGGLARFGYPISEELSEVNTADGRSYTVQYFERARFELHPENQAPYDVLLGQLGREMLAFRQRATRFLAVRGSDLVTGPDLHSVRLAGFNYYPRDAPWAPLDQWPWDRVDFEFGQAQRLGANTLRVFLRYDAFGGPAAGWSQQDDFRRLINLAHQHGLYLVVTLFDKARGAPAPGWDAWPAAGTPEAAADEAYLTAIVGPWKDEPAIAMWDLVNEPDYVDPQEWQWDAHRANRIDWLYRVAAVVRRLDPNHPLTVGLALHTSYTQPDPAGRTVLGLVDVVALHHYAHNDRNADTQAVLDDLRAVTRKPLVIEEAGEATFPGAGDEQSQTALIGDVLSSVRPGDAAGALVWDLYDWPAHAGDPEGHYGLLRADDTAKPAAGVFAQTLAR